MDAHALLEALAGERARFVRFARQRVGTDSDAEDIVQRAALRAAERAASLEDPARVRAWFYRILRNTIVDHRRAASGDASRRDDAELEEIAAEAVAEATTPCACGPRLLTELRPNYAEVIRRIDLDGEEPSSAAAALGISQGNLDVRLHRARRSLRDAVCAYCGVGSHRPCRDCSCDEGRRCGSP